MTHLATPPSGTLAERVYKYQWQGDDRHAALELKRCAIHDFPHPPFCRPPRDRERAAVVSTLVVVVVSDSSPPHSEIDPHFYLSQTFEESNTKRFAQSDNRNTWQEFFGLLGLREARPIRAARGEVQFTWTGSRHVSWKPKKFSVSPLWGKFST